MIRPVYHQPIELHVPLTGDHDPLVGIPMTHTLYASIASDPYAQEVLVCLANGGTLHLTY